MPTVDYEYELPYAYDPDGKRYPRLSFQIAKAGEPSQTIDVEAYLDLGAERSLFSGLIGTALGLDILSGPQLVFQSTMGSRLSTTLHPVLLNHPDLGSFNLEVAFSAGEIHRNLLGRDFFDLAQVGVRERYLTLYITPRP